MSTSRNLWTLNLVQKNLLEASESVSNVFSIQKKINGISFSHALSIENLETLTPETPVFEKILLETNYLSKDGRVLIPTENIQTTHIFQRDYSCKKYDHKKWNKSVMKVYNNTTYTCKYE